MGELRINNETVHPAAKFKNRCKTIVAHGREDFESIWEGTMTALNQLWDEEYDEIHVIVLPEKGGKIANEGGER